MKKILNLLLLILFVTGCSKTQIVEHNNTIIINNTIIKEIQTVCQACPEVKPTIQYINMSIPSENEAILVKEYAKCLHDVAKMQSTIDIGCWNELNDCNTTLSEYINRLDNISWYANKNR